MQEDGWRIPISAGLIFTPGFGDPAIAAPLYPRSMVNQYLFENDGITDDSIELIVKA
jgi:hypothetical protein